MVVAISNFWGNAFWFCLFFGVIGIVGGATDGEAGCMGIGFALFVLGVLGFILLS